MRYYNDIKKSKYKFASKYLNNLDFLGTTEVDEEMVKKTTFGEVDPITHLPFDYSNLTQEEKEKVQEEYLKKKRLIKEKKDNLLKKEEEDEFNLDINLDIRGDNEDEEEYNQKDSNNKMDIKEENKDNNNIINLIESEENINKINSESTNTNSEHFINISDYYNENNNSVKPYKVIKFYEPNMGDSNEKKISFFLADKNKKIKLDEDNKEKEKENINKENEKNDENKINQNIITKRRNTVLSGIDEFDDFLNSYDKVNQQLKSNIIKNNLRNVQLNFEGNKVSIKSYNNFEIKSSNHFDVDKFKLNNI